MIASNDVRSLPMSVPTGVFEVLVQSILKLSAHTLEVHPWYKQIDTFIAKQSLLDKVSAW